MKISSSILSALVGMSLSSLDLTNHNPLLPPVTATRLLHYRTRGGYGRGRERRKGFWNYWSRNPQAQATTISGSTTQVVGPTLYKSECDSEIPNDNSNVTEYLNCLEGVGYYSSPFWFNRDVVESSAFQFVDLPALLGNGSFGGQVLDGANQFDRVTLEYFDFNDDVYNQNIGITYIGYSYYIASCPDTSTSSNATGSCDNLFSLSVYLRSSPESTAYYDCRYDFAPSDYQGGELKWNPVWVGSCSTPDNVQVGSDSSVSQCPPRLREAFDAGYVLGTYGDELDFALGSTPNLIFGLNMGNTTSNDEGLEGYFDKVKVKFDGEDRVTYDLEPAGSSV